MESFKTWSMIILFGCCSGGRPQYLIDSILWRLWHDLAEFWYFMLIWIYQPILFYLKGRVMSSMLWCMDRIQNKVNFIVNMIYFSSVHMTILYTLRTFFLDILIDWRRLILGRQIFIMQIMNRRIYSLFFSRNILNLCFALDERTDLFRIGVALMVESFCEWDLILVIVIEVGAATVHCWVD